MRSPPKSAFYISLSLLTLSFFFYTNLCMFPNQSYPELFHRDLTFSFIFQLHWTRQGRTPAAADMSSTTTNTTTMNYNGNSSTTMLPTTEDMGVPDLYQYALTSPRFRNDRDVQRLKRLLLWNAATDQEKRSWWWYRRSFVGV